MPDPSQLRINDLIRFVSIPDSWSDPECFVHEDCRAFMNHLLESAKPHRIKTIDDDGVPWIEVQVRDDDGTTIHHTWAILEETGWRRVDES